MQSHNSKSNATKRAEGRKMSENDLTREEMAVLTQMISKASRFAISGVAEMVGREVEISTFNLRWVSAEQFSSILKNP